MKHAILLSLLSCLQLLVAQRIQLTGHVIEVDNQQPLEYVAVSVFSVEDSTLIGGSLTGADGQFDVSFPSEALVYVRMQFIGYQPYVSDPLDGTLSQDLGRILLNHKETTLEQVNVTGRASTSLHKIDKQVFDAAQFRQAKGGTVTDVLRNLPGVSVNSLGEISVRGSSGFLVMINGKAVQGDPQVYLNQLPANAIEDIEIVTAPSAKYDPDGQAGIINIITKQAALDGTYIIANAMAGLPSIQAYDNAQYAQRYGADVLVNYKRNKWDFSIGADYRRYDISGRREGYVNTYLGEVLTEFPSDGERSFDEISYSGRASISYQPTQRQRFSAGIYAGKRTKDRTADILYLNQQRSHIPTAQFTSTGQYHTLYQETGSVYDGGDVVNTFTFFNENLRVRRGDFIVGSLDYRYAFPDKSSLQVSGLYERTILGGPTDNVSLAYPALVDTFQLQINDNDNPLDGYRVRVDYQRQLGALTWESGYQFRSLTHPGEFVYFDRDLVNQTWIPNPLFTNDINLTRDIHSLYTQGSGQAKKLNYIAGLRLEYFDRQVEIGRPADTFQLAQWNVFPSLNLTYDLGKGFQLNGGYSRRIERTTTFKMTPFPEREHSETLEQGDAELLPEYIDLVQVGLVQNWGDNVLFGNLYARRIQNVINRVNTVFNDTILNRIYTNVGTANALGLELGTTFYPVPTWRLVLGGNVYRYGIEGELFGEEIQTSNTIWSLNANTQVEITPTLSLQAAFNYLSRRVTAQGEDSEFYNPSLTLRKTWLDGQLGLSLQWLNIDLGLWNANEQRITTERSTFFTTTNYVYEVDIIQLTLSYQLNQPSKGLKTPESEFGKKEF